MAELALLDRSQIFLFVLACHRRGLRVLFFADDLVVVGRSAAETLLMHPVVVGLSRSGGSDRPARLSLPSPPAAVPAAFSALPSLPSAASGPAAPATDSDPDVAQRLRALRRGLRSPPRAFRAAECALHVSMPLLLRGLGSVSGPSFLFLSPPSLVGVTL
jgi:hypothetical protein